MPGAGHTVAFVRAYRVALDTVRYPFLEETLDVYPYAMAETICNQINYELWVVAAVPRLFGWLCFQSMTGRPLVSMTVWFAVTDDEDALCTPIWHPVFVGSRQPMAQMLGGDVLYGPKYFLDVLDATGSRYIENTFYMRSDGVHRVYQTSNRVRFMQVHTSIMIPGEWYRPPLRTRPVLW